MKTSTTERQPVCARRPPEAPAPEDATPTDRLTRVEKIVYLFPEGFDTRKFILGQLDGERLFDYGRAVPAPPGAPRTVPFTFFGRFREQDFAIEIRPRSATIAAQSFDARRDLLLALKEFVDRPRSRP